ncbi:hypothetical protein [Bacillus sp. FJAT-49736]|uniref:hypothetical protein n=1 Tax=Bacillus sp. FJAT-49736 TaxID=2833582 RepID=UPI001BC93510|nr:hypothetical protein [Bacillus sp. FJAT-49736]MBS4174235.1 hypothetical protein [Bacillus sp. FJAT-49736]
MKKWVACLITAVLLLGISTMGIGTATKVEAATVNKQLNDKIKTEFYFMKAYTANKSNDEGKKLTLKALAQYNKDKSSIGKLNLTPDAKTYLDTILNTTQKVIDSVNERKAYDNKKANDKLLKIYNDKKLSRSKKNSEFNTAYKKGYKDYLSWTMDDIVLTQETIFIELLLEDGNNLIEKEELELWHSYIAALSAQNMQKYFYNDLIKREKQFDKKYSSLLKKYSKSKDMKTRLTFYKNEYNKTKKAIEIHAFGKKAIDKVNLETYLDSEQELSETIKSLKSINQTYLQEIKSLTPLDLDLATELNELALKRL